MRTGAAYFGHLGARAVSVLGKAPRRNGQSQRFYLLTRAPPGTPRNVTHRRSPERRTTRRPTAPKLVPLRRSSSTRTSAPKETSIPSTAISPAVTYLLPHCRPVTSLSRAQLEPTLAARAFADAWPASRATSAGSRRRGRSDGGLQLDRDRLADDLQLVVAPQQQPARRQRCLRRHRRCRPGTHKHARPAALGSHRPNRLVCRVRDDGDLVRGLSLRDRIP